MNYLQLGDDEPRGSDKGLDADTSTGQWLVVGGGLLLLASSAVLARR